MFCRPLIEQMDLDLFDAIRLQRIVEFDVDGVRYAVEPYAFKMTKNNIFLRAFVVQGPSAGWAEFSRWTNLRITRDTYAPRNDPGKAE